MTLRFYPMDHPAPLKFAVIAAQSGGKRVWCRHRDRTTWEFPGGHHEPGETILETAARELREETGALDFTLEPVCVYAVDRDGDESCGMLFRAEVTAFGPLEWEIEEIRLSDDPPGAWTYPEIQPGLLRKLLESEAQDA